MASASKVTKTETRTITEEVDTGEVDLRLSREEAEWLRAVSGRHYYGVSTRIYKALGDAGVIADFHGEDEMPNEYSSAPCQFGR